MFALRRSPGETGLESGGVEAARETKEEVPRGKDVRRRVGALLGKELTDLGRSKRRKILGLSIVLLLVIGLLDYATSIELNLFTFYWIPIALVTWYCGPRAGYGMALASVAFTVGGDVAGGVVHRHYLYLVWDFFSELVSFAVLVWIVAKLKQLYMRALRTSQLEVELRASQAAFEELKGFGYIIAHNWRAPLRSIDGYSQLLIEDYGARLGPTGQEYLQRLRRSSQFIADLVNALLELIEFSGGEMRRERVELSAVAESVAAKLRTKSPEQAVEFTAEPGLVAMGDRQLLGIALECLLSNAWKFTRNQGRPRVAFGAQPGKDGKVYFVRDNGIGFDMTHARMLFTPHQSVHRSGQFEGVGIGLPIAERIIRRHGGRIWAEAEPGKGATFYFTLGEASEPERV